MVIALIFGILDFNNFIKIGPGYYYPNIPISSFIVILRMIYTIFQMLIFMNLGLLINIPINRIKKFPKEIDLDDLVLKPSHNDPSGGFRELGQLVIMVSFVLIFLIIINVVIEGIELIVKRIITEPFSPVKENALEIESILKELSPLIIIIILFAITIGFQVYIILEPYSEILKKYKKSKLKPLYEKKNEIIRKVFNENSQIKMTNKQLNEMQKTDYLINEINSISNWPVKFTLIISIFGSGFLPAIITIIFKLIEIFVLK